MSQEPHWMSSLPAWEGVGAEPGVDNTEMCLQIWLSQIKIVLPQLTRIKLTLVHYGLGGQRADVDPHSSTGNAVGRHLEVIC